MEVSYQPYSKLIIHSYVQHDLSNLVRILVSNVAPEQIAPSALFWAEGLAMQPVPYLHTEPVVSELLKGIVHWDGVAVAQMPTYQRELVVPPSNAKVLVLDVSSSPLYRAAAEWLKKAWKLGKD